MEEILQLLKEHFKNINYKPGKLFYWSPEKQAVFYEKEAKGKVAIWSVLHETGHALLGHTNYKHDFELLSLEVGAWQKARELASQFKLAIDENHIEECLDTYRDWLDKRCRCPSCGNKSFQADANLYRCYNCSAVWRVSRERFCRTYRLAKQKEPSAVFETAKGS